MFLKLRIKKLTLVAILISVGMVLGVVEARIPVFNIFPGAKIGISNIVNLLGVYLLNPLGAVLIAITKSFFVSIFIGAPSSFLYSGTGALFSTGVMLLAKKLLKDKISAVGVSILGALVFNFAQCLVAAIVVNNMYILGYLPFLWFISAFSGLITGSIANGILGVIRNV